MKIKEKCSGCGKEVYLEKDDLKPLNKTEKAKFKKIKDKLKEIGEEEIFVISELRKIKKKYTTGFKVTSQFYNIHKKWICCNCNQINYLGEE